MNVIPTTLLIAGLAAGACFWMPESRANDNGYGQERPRIGWFSRPPDRIDQILERLERIEAKLDRTGVTVDDIGQVVEDLAGPQTFATFCINQGRGLELAGEYAGGLEIEVEVGPGWAAAIHGEATGEVDLPFFIPPTPITPPIPIPTEAKIELKGGLGRATDICVELPIVLSPQDNATLEQLASDINSDTGDGFSEQGKFQRRAGRILRYAARRVPGDQGFGVQDVNGFIVSDTEADADDEFDRADLAGDSLLDGGFGNVAEGLDVFRDPNISELLATLDIPTEVSAFMNDPERMFSGLADLGTGEGPLFCNDAGISGDMRSRNERLDRLCRRLENLPTFNRLRSVPDTIDGLSDELVDAIAGIVSPLLENAGETASDTKRRFCDSRIGQRSTFDRYCEGER